MTKHFLFANTDTVRVAEKYGTPVYLTSEEKIRENYQKLYSAFSKRYPKFRSYYAAKANTNTAVLRILEQEGSYVDTVSTGEIHLALKAGFSPEKIIYTANNFSEAELKYAVEKKVAINLDDVSQIKKLARIGKTPLVSFRVNPLIGAGHHDHCITAGKNVKFGIPERDIVSAYEAAKKQGFTRFGIHMHIGSGILDPEPFAKATEKMMQIVGRVAKKAKIVFDFVDLGGGFGVPYRPNEKKLDIEKTAEKIVKEFKKGCEKHGLGEPWLCVEPGRYLVCDSTVLLTRVNTVKKAYKTFVGVDAGFNVLIRPAFYGSYHEIVLANDPSAKKTTKCDVVGPVCESGDVLARDRMLPKIKENDVLAILNAGAYGFSMSSQYNSRPRPAELLISGGEINIIREKETFEDLDRRVKIPRRLS